MGGLLTPNLAFQRTPSDAAEFEREAMIQNESKIPDSPEPENEVLVK